MGPPLFAIKDCTPPSKLLCITRFLIGLALALAARPVGAISEPRAPHFLHEPPSRVEFLNGTGAVVPCVVHGSPAPRVTWSTRAGQPLHEVPGLRHMRADGSLVLPPFRAEDFKEDVHSAIYRCLGTNSLGTIGSHDVRVRAGSFSETTGYLSQEQTDFTTQ
ncbi:cell adhesion molecule Dscam1-like [Dermacentor variabilis]|uniref:cell adhesion molecule Dscam1-like n=1 Tax=Dermacentor variabilis TaxID=34621 RepID=UPI003F5BD5A9